MTTPNTPEKPTTGDNCPWCGSPEDFVYTGSVHVVIYKCCTWKNTINDRSELCHALEAKNKAEATIAERDQTIKNQNLLAREEAKILQRWKEWGIKEEQKRKKAEAELAEVKETKNAKRRELLEGASNPAPTPSRRKSARSYKS